MPVAFSIPRHVAKLEHQREKKVSGGSEQHLFSRSEVARGSHRQQEQRDIAKGAKPKGRLFRFT